ncbi:MAG: zinc-ribbon domain-containing protein [Clostridia bacterium]|nr:zinc-ribbon domain-containing protein [Clostridia bacterium]
MFCKKCGKELSDQSRFCPSCGSPQQGIIENQSKAYPHDVPRCTACGYTGEFTSGPLIRGSDWLWFFLLFFFFGSGVIYMLFIIIIRWNPNNREKICPHCKSKNMFTYLY